MAKTKIKYPKLTGSYEAVYKINIPIRDNSGRPVKKQVIKKYMNELNKCFGGSTSYNTYGCWVKNKKLVCDKNITIETARDFDTPYDTKDDLKACKIIKNKKLKKYSLSERKKQMQSDYKFINKLAGKVAKQLGQDGVFVENDLVKDVGFVKYRYKNKANKKYLDKEFREFKFE